MVFDVPPPFVMQVIQIGELAKDFLGVFADDICKDAEAAAVRHADHDVVDAAVAGSFDQQVEQRDQGLAAFQRKAFCADEFFLDEVLEDRGIGQLGQDPQLACLREVNVVTDRFHPLLEPFALTEIVDVHEFNADRACVGFAKSFNDFARRVQRAA